MRSSNSRSKCRPAVGAANCAVAAGVHGLIAFGVCRGCLPADIGRQGHFADAFEHARDVLPEAQLEQGAVSAEHLGFNLLSGPALQQQTGACLRRLACAHLGQRPARFGNPLDQHFHLAAAVLAAVQPRANHPGVVKAVRARAGHSDSAVRAVVRETPMPRHLRRISIEAQQPACRTDRRGSLGDPFRRQIVVVIVSDSNSLINHPGGGGFSCMEGAARLNREGRLIYHSLRRGLPWALRPGSRSAWQCLSRKLSADWLPMPEWWNW